MSMRRSRIEHTHIRNIIFWAREPDLLRMVEAATHDGTPLMLLYVDIDHFRSINENMGVEVGDEALAILSDRLQQALGTEARAWRHGSDEFIVAVPRSPGLGTNDVHAQHPIGRGIGEHLHEAVSLRLGASTAIGAERKASDLVAHTVHLECVFGLPHGGDFRRRVDDRRPSAAVYQRSRAWPKQYQPGHHGEDRRSGRQASVDTAAQAAITHQQVAATPFLGAE